MMNVMNVTNTTAAAATRTSKNRLRIVFCNQAALEAHVKRAQSCDTLIVKPIEE